MDMRGYMRAKQVRIAMPVRAHIYAATYTSNKQDRIIIKLAKKKCVLLPKNAHATKTGMPIFAWEGER
jgi:hypothetical protein